MDIINAIPVGADNAIHLQRLAELAGCTDSTIKKRIQAARRQGIIVLSGQKGYWKPTTLEEQRRFLLMMDKAAKARFSTTKPLRSELKRIPNQLNVEEFKTVREELQR